MKKSVATEVAELAVEFQHQMEELLMEQFQSSIGYEKVSEKEMTQLIKDAMQGNVRAFMEVQKLAQVNGHQGDNDGCPICVRINSVLKKPLEVL